jgi:hypothetical protein
MHFPVHPDPDVLTACASRAALPMRLLITACLLVSIMGSSITRLPQARCRAGRAGAGCRGTQSALAPEQLAQSAETSNGRDTPRQSALRFTDAVHRAC